MAGFGDVLKIMSHAKELQVAAQELKEELLRYCAQHIARYAMPKEILFRTELPKTLVGKVAYRVLEEEAAKEAQK